MKEFSSEASRNALPDDIPKPFRRHNGLPDNNREPKLGASSSDRRRSKDTSTGIVRRSASPSAHMLPITNAAEADQKAVRQGSQPPDEENQRHAAVIARLRKQVAVQQDVIRELRAAGTADSENVEELKRTVSDLRAAATADNEKIEELLRTVSLLSDEVRTLRLVSSPLQFRAFMDLLVGRFGVDSEGNPSVFLAAEALARRTGLEEQTIGRLLRFVQSRPDLGVIANRRVVAPMLRATMPRIP
jgi:hypothetical protein